MLMTKLRKPFFHQVYTMKWHDIPAKVADKSLLPNSADSLQLNINFDQMGIYILTNGNSTFHDRGANQVDIVAKDEKMHIHFLLPTLQLCCILLL